MRFEAITLDFSDYFVVAVVVCLLAGWLGARFGPGLLNPVRLAHGFTWEDWVERLVNKLLPNVRREQQEGLLFRGLRTADLPGEAADVLSPQWGGSVNTVAGANTPRYARLIAAEIKLRFPYSTLERTSADLLSVQAAARELFKRDNLRTRDQVRFMPLITALVFTPSEEEILLQTYLQSRDHEDTVRRYQAKTDDHFLDALLGNSRRAQFVRK